MTMPPIRANFRYYAGCTFSTGDLEIEDADGAPIDTSGWTGEMNVWREDDDPSVDTPLFVLSTANGKLVNGGVDGTWNGTLPADEAIFSVDIDSETWPYKMQLTNPAPNPDYVERTVEGIIIAQP